MREILFRGKCADNYKNSGKWAEGYLLRFTEKRNPFIMLKDGGGECVEVIPESVGQYTGLTDKNGKKVFEGDILFSSYIADSPSIEVVKWIYNGWHTQEGNLTPDMIDDVGIMPYSEVIGNVHDNPGLLKGEKNA